MHSVNLLYWTDCRLLVDICCSNLSLAKKFLSFSYYHNLKQRQMKSNWFEKFQTKDNLNYNRYKVFALQDSCTAAFLNSQGICT